MTHHVSLKGIIQEAFTKVPLTKKEEFLVINPKAIKFFHFTDATGMEDTAILENTNGDASADNLGAKLLWSIPFEF